MNPNGKYIIWTPQMLRLIRDYYPTMFNKPLAKWVGVSQRSLQRKAKELGLKKVDNFNKYKADDLSRLLSEGVKKAYRDGRLSSAFKPGVRSNPDGEFRPGHRFDPETEERRTEKIRRTYRRMKLLRIYGLSK